MGRYFVAVYPPEPVLDEIAGLPRPEARGLRWTRRDHWHVTLAFLGDVDEAEVVDALRTVDHPPVRTVLGPAVARLRKHVVMIPAAGLDELATGVLAALEPVVADLPTRPFRGHLTLARAKERIPREAVGHPVDIAFGVSEFALVSSRLDHDGAEHAVVARFPLSGAGARPAEGAGDG